MLADVVRHPGGGLDDPLWLVECVVALNRQAIDVGALARAVVQDVELGGHPLQVDADPIVAKVDAVQIERIVENLVTNAVRHTPEGTSVWLGVRAQGGGVLISVEDAGPGVPPDRREAVFQPFERGEAARQGVPGIGIGLALVREFAGLHGGRAWVEQGSAGGARFVVELPDGGALEDERPPALLSADLAAS